MSYTQNEFLYEVSEIYYKNALSAQSRGDLARARENLRQSASALLRYVKQDESGDKSAKLERVKRAENLLKIADNLDEKSHSIEFSVKNAGGGKPKTEAQGDNDGKLWKAAEIPEVTFDDVVGLDEAKAVIKLKMILPAKFPEKFAEYGKKSGGGVLLYGPPGNGKTMIAKAIAHEVGATFFSVKASDVVSKWVGESEKNISSLFDAARKEKLAIIFIDEIEGLFRQRGADLHNDNRVTEFLQQIDGFAGKCSNILLLGATNRPWDVDTAAMRSGRLSEKIYVPLPDKKARAAMFRKALGKMPLDPNVDVEKLAGITEYYSGADIDYVCDKASDAPIIDYIQTNVKGTVSMTDLVGSISKWKPSVSPAEIAKFEQYAGVQNVKTVGEVSETSKTELRIDKTEQENPQPKEPDASENGAGNSAEVVFAEEVLAILPGTKPVVEFFVPVKVPRVYLEIGGKRYSCLSRIMNWRAEVDITEAGDYEAVVSADKVLARKKLCFTKGVRENDMGLDG